MNLKFYQRYFLSFLAYSARKIKLNYPPLFFTIEPTNRCNFKCIYCPQSYSTGINMEKGEMNIGLFETIIQKIAQTNPVGPIFLTGNGEPLLHPQLEKFINLICKYGLHPSFTSNGLLLDMERINSLASAGDFSITVDFSPYKELYEKARINGNWEKVYQNLKNLLQFKKNANCRNIKVTIKDMSTIFLKDEKSVANSMKELKRMFSDLPMDNFTRVAFHNWIGNIDQKVIPLTAPNRNYNLCSHPWSLMQINFKGQVVACCRDMASQFVVGEISDKTNLMEIWNGRKMIQLRKALAQKRASDIVVCKNCDRPKMGGSMGKNKMEMLKNFISIQRSSTRE